MSLIINYLDFFPCHDCCQLFISKQILSEHNAKEHPGKGSKSDLSEKIVDESCTDYQFLDEEKQSDFREGEVYSCGECGQSYQTINELKYHVILHASKFECPIEECGCQYDQLSRLSIHVLNKHINTKNLQCLHCSQAFPTYDDLQTHLKHFCKEKKFKCYECGRQTIPTTFYWHNVNNINFLLQIKNSSRKRLSSRTCERWKRKNSSANFAARHSNNRVNSPFICDHTRKLMSVDGWTKNVALEISRLNSFYVAYFSSIEMSGHSSVLFAINHTRPVACAQLIWIRISGHFPFIQIKWILYSTFIKLFFGYFHFFLHQRKDVWGNYHLNANHSLYNFYLPAFFFTSTQCQLCDKKLQSRTSYRNHMKRHTEEKKHECEHCGKRFFTRYHLKLHQSKIHKTISAETASNSGGDLAQLIDDDSTMIIFE